MPKYRLVRIETPEDIVKHKEAILSLWKRSLPKLSEDCFDWVYKDNPEGPAKTVLAQCIDSNEFVGCAAVYPRAVFVQGRQKKAGILINFGIDAQHRVFGPALLLQKEILTAYLSKEYDFIFGYPNQHAEGIFKRAGYLLVGKGDYWTKVLDWSSKTGKVLKVKFLSVLVGRLLECIYSLPGWFYTTSLKDFYEVKIISEPGKDFNQLWETAGKSYGVIGTRDHIYLKWRYQSNAYASCKFFCVYDQSQHMLGYVAYKQNARVINIDDFFAADTVVAKVVFALFVRHMRQTGSSAVIMVHMGDKKFRDCLKGQCVIRKQNARPALIVFGSGLTDQEKSCLLDKNNWHIFDGELDL